MNDLDQEILEDMICVLLPKHRGTCSRIATHILNSAWLAEHDRAVAEYAWAQGWVTHAIAREFLSFERRRRIDNPYRKQPDD